MVDAGFDPDPWQAALLRSTDARVLICAARQVGKSRATSFLALHQLLTVPGSTTVILAPVAEQSSELLRKVSESYHALNDPVPVRREAVTRLELANGSRVIALPGTERRVRSYTSALLIIDEAARVPDDVLNAASPTMAVSRGRFVALSTAFAKSGWFYRGWTDPAENYRRLSITARDCPRIPREFLEAEKKRLGHRWFSMEYLNEFGDDCAAVFREDDIRAMRSTAVRPFRLPEYPGPTEPGDGGPRRDEPSTITPAIKPMLQ